jgi:hypothetical protein
MWPEGSCAVRAGAVFPVPPLETYERLFWEHHEADMEQLTRMREWLDKMERQLS